MNILEPGLICCPQESIRNVLWYLRCLPLYLFGNYYTTQAGFWAGARILYTLDETLTNSLFRGTVL